LSKEMDQSLSAKVLKVANSAYYGTRTSRRVNSVHRAIVLIGFNGVKEIILTASLFHTFQETGEVESLKPLWEHSLECAFVSKRLAWMYRYEAVDEAYLVGLVHDIGKLVIQQHFRDEFQLIRSKGEGVFENLDAEKEVLGITHAEIAGKMSAHWDFPEPIVEAITHHHEEKWKLNPILGRILYNANRFVWGLVDFEKMIGSFSEAGMRYPATWKTEELKRVEETLQEEREQARSLLN